LNARYLLFHVPPRSLVPSQDGLPRGSAELIVRPLYAALPYDEQLKALEPAQIMKDGRPMRKCIVSTNIAETSVTIPGIVYVVDAGFVKVRKIQGHGLRVSPLCIIPAPFREMWHLEPPPPAPAPTNPPPRHDCLCVLSRCLCSIQCLGWTPW
jgi:hypothetical protein